MKLLSLKRFSIQKGFTLIEILVVIAIIGVLAAVTLTAINPLKRIQQANDAGVKSDIAQIAQAMQAYYTSSSTTAAPYYPADVAALVTSGDLKQEPKIPPARILLYTITGAAGAARSEAAVYGAMNETGAGYWCWSSTTGRAGKSATAPTALVATCP
ncbi:MAG: prepilin-type N-terminal cleavage/methylation domain-containing protein [Candidatus Levybacteria bacterium]|nr:prepilin-type N-terminal cleavage/methylation domain-containing protein [Candidatus Levybacteria bacterium]